MTGLIRHKFISILLAASLLATAVPQTALAGTGLIYISPGGSSLQVGSSETLSLRINPGTTVDGVQATVSYNPSLLQLNYVDNSASPFSVQLQKSAGGGTITLSLGNLSGGVSSDALIAYMNFTALTGSGSTSLTISGANATSGGSYTNPASSGASVSFTAPAPPPAPVSGGGGSSTHKLSGGSKTNTQASAVAPAASTPSTDTSNAPTDSTPVKLKAKLLKTSYTGATVSITSNQNLNLYILYGSDAKNLANKSAVTSSASKATVTVGGTLTPGTTYYYQVVGEDSNGNQTKLPVQQFMTTGYTVQVSVLDKNNQLLAHSKVTLHSRAQTVTTDDHGVATFTNVAPGLHHLDYQAGGRAYSSVVFVQNSLPAQTVAAVLPVVASHSSWSGWLVVLGALALVGLALDEVRTRVRFHGKRLAFRLAIAAHMLLF